MCCEYVCMYKHVIFQVPPTLFYETGSLTHLDNQAGYTGWPVNLKDAHLSLTPYYWDLNRCHSLNSFSLWVLKIELRSSCLHRKHFTNWVISLAFNGQQLVWIIEVPLFLARMVPIPLYKLGNWDVEQVGNLAELSKRHKLRKWDLSLVLWAMEFACWPNQRAE